MNQASTLKELFQSVIESSTGTVTNDLYHITASGWIGTITISNNNNNNAVLIQGGPKKSKPDNFCNMSTASQFS